MKAILFDFDGVVVRSMEDHYEGWRRVLEEYQIQMAPEELFVLEGQGVEAIANQLMRKYNLPLEEAPKVIEKKRLYYEQLKRVEFYPNLIEILQWGKEKELKIGLVTGGDRDRVESTFDSFGINSFFDVVITANDVVNTKPSPEPYLLAARLLNVNPEDCIVIENAPLGIRSAKAAGMTCIAVTSTLPVMYLTEADVIVINLQEVLSALKKLY